MRTILALIILFSLTTSVALGACRFDDPAGGDDFTVVPRQIGCYNYSLCVLGPNDVSPLKDYETSLGIKTVATGYPILPDGTELKFKFFDIFEVGRTDLPTMAKPGYSIILVDHLGFYNERALEGYIRSKPPGKDVMVTFKRQGGAEAEVCMKVIARSAVRFKSELPEFFSFEDAQALLRNQDLLAFMGAAREVAPYLLLFGLSQQGALSGFGGCVSMGYPGICD